MNNLGEKRGAFVIRIFLIIYLLAAYSGNAFAERVMVQSTINIRGESHRYFHLYDVEKRPESPVILLIDGSGCRDFSLRFESFFVDYAEHLNAYLLEKPGVENSGDGGHCTTKFLQRDQLQNTVLDHLVFMKTESDLKTLGDKSITLLGLSEGADVAVLVAARSKKIGWLATGGSGGVPQAEQLLIFVEKGVSPYKEMFTRSLLDGVYAAIKSDPDNLTRQFFGHSYRYWSMQLFFDPLPLYAALDIPIVVAMGEKEEVSPVESGRVLAAYFASHPERNFQYIEFPGANHGLRKLGDNGVHRFIAALPRWMSGDKSAFKWE